MVDDIFIREIQEHFEKRKEDTKVLFDIYLVREHFLELLKDLEHVVSFQDLENFQSAFKRVEEDYQKVVQEVEEEEDCDTVEDSISELDENLEEVFDKSKEVEQSVSKKEDIHTSIHTQYDAFMGDANDLMDTVEYHKKNIQKYISLIDQIQAREVTVYRSSIVQKTASLATKFIQRSIESTVLSGVVPKKVAQLYLVARLMNDTKNIVESDPLVITQKEVDTSYYDELIHDQCSIKSYRGMLTSLLAGVCELKEKYKESCRGFPNYYLYQENMKKLDELEDMLVLEETKLEDVVSSYDDAIDYQEQKIKVLKDS